LKLPFLAHTSKRRCVKTWVYWFPKNLRATSKF
jgi:hypothetical protein